MTEDELLNLVNTEFESAMGQPGGDISQERALALDMYNSKAMGNEVDGQSSVVTSDVADVVDGIMPSLLRIFTTAENLVSFDPADHTDVEKAEQSSDYVSYVFFKQNPAFLILWQWFFDALLQKCGITKAWWDESEIVSTETYSGLTDVELAELLADEELEPIERDERTIEVPGAPFPITVYDIKFRRVSKSGRARVINVPPDEYRISADARSLDPSEARMVGQEREATRSELLEMGFDKDLVDILPAYNDQITSTEQAARQDKSDEFSDSTNDRSQDKILIREAYVKVDYDGDGRSELRQVFTAGNHVLSNEEADRQPFHVICPYPIAHKHFGNSVADKVMDIQEVNTTLLRQVLTNLYHTNNPGNAVWEHGMSENTLDDLLTTHVGRTVRFQRPVSESWQPMAVPFTANASFPMLEYFDKVKRDRTGISSDGEGLSPEALKNIQSSVLIQAFDISRMKIEAVARVFAETGIKSLFLHLHELLLKHQKKDQIVKLRNQFVAVNPNSWRSRFDMTVNIGLGIGTREQNLLHLDQIWQKQQELAASGQMNLTVTPQNMFMTASEIVKNANLKQPEMFFQNPGNQPAPPPSSEQAEIQRQALAIQERQQQLDAQDQQIKQSKVQLEAQSDALSHQRDLAKLQESSAARQDKFLIENEKLRNDLTQITAEFRSERFLNQLKEAKTQAEVQQLVANATKTRAETAKIVVETEAQGIENQAVKSGLDQVVAQQAEDIG
jgi:hypothetical protein